MGTFTVDKGRPAGRKTPGLDRSALLVSCYRSASYGRPAPAAAFGQPACSHDGVRLGRIIFAIFLVLQIADGLITFGAVKIFGSVAEGNPILATWILVAGPAVTLFAAKATACGLAAVLYRTGRERTLAALTGLLLCAAVAPWLAVLAGVPR